MSSGLSVNRFINVSATLTPRAVGERNFGVALIVGDSEVIDVAERIREYNSLEEVAADFATTAPEYRAAAVHFSQVPKSNIILIGRWARVATRARLKGRALTTGQKVLANFTAVTAGSFRITINGTQRTVTGVDLSAATNLNGVASILQTALQGQVPNSTVVYEDRYSRFVVRSGTSGASSTISYAEAAPTGTDISGLLGLAASANTPAPVGGIDAETPIDAVNIMADMSTHWYALQWACATYPTRGQYYGVARTIEGFSVPRVQMLTTQEVGNKDRLITDSLSDLLKADGLNATAVMYSGTSPYAMTSLWARFSTINFDTPNAMITGAWKELPGIAPDDLTATEASTLESRNCNYYAGVNNGSKLTFPGVMSGGWYIDERVGIDWLVNAVQTAEFNLLKSQGKIPQTDDGTALRKAVIARELTRAVENGLLAPGQWNGPPIGQINTGDTLTSGFHIHAPRVSTQSQADREARKGVPITVLAKLAGAVHTTDVAIQFNR